MSQNSRMMNDLAQLANGAFSTIGSAKDEAESMIRQKIERIISESNVVTREEFEIVREMVIEARKENELLKAEIEALKQSKPKQSKPK